MEYASASALVGTLHLYLLAGIFFETYFSIESEGLSSISEDKILWEWWWWWSGKLYGRCKSIGWNLAFVAAVKKDWFRVIAAVGSNSVNHIQLLFTFIAQTGNPNASITKCSQDSDPKQRDQKTKTSFFVSCITLGNYCKTGGYTNVVYRWKQTQGLMLIHWTQCKVLNKTLNIARITNAVQVTIWLYSLLLNVIIQI